MLSYFLIGLIMFIVVSGMIKEWRRVDVQEILQREHQHEIQDLEEHDYRSMQAWVGDWSDRVLKPKGVTLSGTYKHLQKEVTELGEELDILIANSEMLYLQKQELLERIAKELADIDIVTCHIAHQLDIELAEHIIEKMKTNENRKWAVANSEGVSQHID